jgi:hypothetical protein
MSGGREIFTLFGVDDEAAIERLCPVEEIRREDRSSYGRTDIEVRFGDRGLFLIEIKVQEPGSELASQLERYARMVGKAPGTDRQMVLIGIRAPDHSILPFAFTSWQTVCERLRRYAYHIKDSEMLRAAAILIFCGAVEQNLLGFSSQPRRFTSITTIDHLRRWQEDT